MRWIAPKAFVTVKFKRSEFRLQAVAVESRLKANSKHCGKASWRMNVSAACRIEKHAHEERTLRGRILFPLYSEFDICGAFPLEKFLVCAIFVL